MPTSELTLPKKGGNGPTLSEASEKDLNYWRDRKAKELGVNPEGKFADYSRRLIDGIDAELARRAEAPEVVDAEPEPEPEPKQALAPSLAGSITDPAEANRRLQEGLRLYHVVTPAAIVGSIPEGCEVQFSLIKIDEKDPHLYKAEGKLCLDKYHLLQFLNAIGGSITRSERIDDGSHPHLCRVVVGVTYRQFDGSPAYREGTAELDVREPDGARYVDIVQKAKASNRDPRRQLLELRKFIYPQTESRALNRAIAALGVRRSYLPAELKKPFLVAKVAFTGRSDDPEARAQFRAAMAQSFLGGSQALYGAPQVVETPKELPGSTE